MAALTRSEGTTVIVENMFESRYRHVDELCRMGADIRIKCLGCGSSVLMPRVKFEKKLKRVVEHAPQSENAQEN